MKKLSNIILLFSLIILGNGFAPAQNNNVLDSIYVKQTQQNFDNAYNEIVAMLDNKQPLSFKRAVFLVENAYLNDSLNYGLYVEVINLYKKLVLAYNKSNKLLNYNFADSTNENINASIFKVFTDTLKDENNKIISLPFRYNFEDALGSKDYESTFVNYLLFTKKGNCHSLPYLYKILTEEFNTKSYLALAPMHIYIKQRNKNIGWYNVELTSGQYPKDAYLISTGYISHDNIISGLYMDTLSLKQSIAMCLMDLCQAYAKKLNQNASLNFQLQCTDKALQIKPNYLDALLRKQRLHKTLWLSYQKQNNTEFANSNKTTYNEINNKLIQLDYRDVPLETFQKWYTSYQQNKSKFQNHEINTNFKSNK
ncbi:MAG: hypothetical protein SFY56_03075 [Bacteroidota bacterium]|nr:hypothetical protein [Bacteroidota bacterium]